MLCVCHSWIPPGYEASFLIIPVAGEFQPLIEDGEWRIEDGKMEDEGRTSRIEDRR
jgi:hypothetical protein